MLENFFKTMSIIALALCYSGIAQAQGKYTKEIAPGVYSFGSGNGFHSMFIVTDEGVAAFETMNSTHSAEMVEAIRDVTDKPIRYAFHSHNHWDHASGGKVFQDLGAKTVMHSLAAEWLDANPGQDTSFPSIVWKGSRYDIKMGGVTIEAHYLGMNHGLGMTVIVIPERRVAYIADLVTPNRVMFSIVPDFNIGGWERSLEEMQTLEFDIAVCSHSELPADVAESGCTMEHVSEELQYLRDLRGAIFAEFEKGTPGGEVASAVRLPQYAHWVGYDDWLEMNAWRVMLDGFMGPYPWVSENKKWKGGRHENFKRWRSGHTHTHK